jgi:V8-like Glu-specific endopeptidase
VDYVEEKEMKEVPHRHIGVVLAVYSGSIFQLGTGILISRDLVLTCAHVTHAKAY